MPRAKFWFCGATWVSLDNLPNPSESQFLQYSGNNNMLQIHCEDPVREICKKSCYLINFSLLFWFSPQAICKVYLVCLSKFLLFLKFSTSHVQSEQCQVGNLGAVQSMDAVRFSMEGGGLVVGYLLVQQDGRSQSRLYADSRKGQRFLIGG